MKILITVTDDNEELISHIESISIDDAIAQLGTFERNYKPPETDTGGEEEERVY